MILIILQKKNICLLPKGLVAYIALVGFPEKNK
jgi:hypothetical protein